jgi:transcription termination factor Rho
MSGEQLERSILERKEREELKAIAVAMSLEPVARSKKADLVDQILRAAGVEVGSGVTANGANGAAPSSEAKAAENATGSDAAGAAGSDTNGKAAKPRATRARTTKAKAGVSVDADAGTDATAAAGGEDVEAGGPVAGTAGRRSAASTVSVDHNGQDGNGSPSDASPAPEATSSEMSRSESGANGAFAAGGEPSGADDDEAATRSSASADTSESGSPESQSNGTGGSSHGRQDFGDGNAQRGNSAGNAQGGNHGNQGNQSNQGGQQNRPRQQQGGGQNQQNQGGQGGVDVGNRRSRRRRGRDRADRELQGAQGQQEVPFQGELVPVKGLLDLREEGYGFLRTSGYLPSSKDVYVSVSQARRFALRRGDAVEGACRPAGPSEKYPALLRIDVINGMTPDEARERPRFEDLTPLFPDDRLRLEHRDDPLNVTARIVDLISPIGKGQRGMIVSPSKAGKTTVLKQIAHSVELNNPDVHLMVLLVDERPEEVTDMRRSVKGEVMASTFDRPADEHTALSELVMERAKRLVEMGRDVVIILDGITRLARAYNLAQPATGRIMSGGVDSGALYPPKKFFGAARNIEEGGSLTILATALIETGSKMDEVIFEEFKGTGNMELRLDRKLAERRIYPAIDVNASSTRHEELLFDRNQLQQVWKLRRVLNALGAEGSAAAGLELLMDKIKTTKSNDEFLAEIAKAPMPSN